jgi:hypothetical protein
MLDILSKHLSNEVTGCTVSRWIDSLPQEEQDAFASVKEKSARIKIAVLFSDLTKESELPFKLTAFRSHMRDYCTCQN